MSHVLTKVRLDPVSTVGISGSVAISGSPVAGCGVVQLWDVFGSTLVDTAAVDGAGDYAFVDVVPATYYLMLHPSLAYCLGDAEDGAQSSVVTDQRQVVVGESAVTGEDFDVQAAFFSDDFQSYSDVTDLVNNGPYAWTNSGDVGLDTSLPDAMAGQAMTYVFPDRTGVGTNYSIQARYSLSDSTTHYWSRFLDYVDAAWENGIVGYSNEYKHWMVNVGSVSLDRIRSLLQASDASRIACQVNVETSPFGFARISDGDYSDFRGAWRVWHHHVLNLADGADLVFAMYLDGSKLVGSGSDPMPVGPADVHPTPADFRYVELGANINSGPDQEQRRYIREWGIYPTRPSLLTGTS